MKDKLSPWIFVMLGLAALTVGGALAVVWRPVTVSDPVLAAKASPVPLPMTASQPPSPSAAPEAPAMPDVAASTAPAAPAKKGKPALKDPGARAALSLVGVEPLSEAIWLTAINNPSLPAQERQDLIEDLNEDGLSNQKRPGAADLPLIRARLALIDRLLPQAMDQTNADAFAEARKDLLKMAARLSP